MSSCFFCQNCRVAIRAITRRCVAVIFGVNLLQIAIGAGTESQKVIGTAGFGGMIAATFLSQAVVERLYHVVQMTVERMSSVPHTP